MHAVKTIFIGLILFLILFAIPSAIFAQTPPKGIESCFAYYDYGRIKAQFAAKNNTYESGETAMFNGSIVNNNTFPIVDVILYAHVRRINPTTSVDNGHYLIDKVTLLQDLSFLPNESKRLEFKLPIKKTYPEGQYEIQYFIFSKQAFHYGGRSFLEEDNAGTTTFTIQSDTKPDVFFDVNSLRVNNEPHNIREQIVEFPKGPLELKVGVTDTRALKTDLPVKIKFYSFEDTDGNKLISQIISTYKADQKDFSFTFNAPTPGAYVMLLEISTPIQSMFKYRFATLGDAESELRMNDLGVSNFPGTSQSRAWVCFHSPTRQNSAKTTINLNILNSNKKSVSSVSVTDSFSGEVQAISVPLSKLTSFNNFWVEAIFTQNGKSRSVQIHYDCSVFTSSIRDLKLNYDEAQPDRLLIRAENSCGQANNVKLQALRIRQNGKTITEVRNYDASHGYFLLKNLPPGKYLAEARFGKLTPKVDFTIPASMKVNKIDEKKSPPPLSTTVIIGLVFLVMIITLIALFSKRKK